MLTSKTEVKQKMCRSERWLSVTSLSNWMLSYIGRDVSSYELFITYCFCFHITYVSVTLCSTISGLELGSYDAGGVGMQ